MTRAHLQRARAMASCNGCERMDVCMCVWVTLTWEREAPKAFRNHVPFVCKCVCMLGFDALAVVRTCFRLAQSVGRIFFKMVRERYA